MAKGGQKRPATDAVDERPSKAAKTEPTHPSFEPNKEIEVARIPKGFSPTNWVSGTVVGTWPVDEKNHRRFVIAPRSGTKLRVDILLTSPSVLDAVQSGERVAISLKGASNKPNKAKAEGEGEIMHSVAFNKGVVIKLLKRGNGKDDVIIDTNALPPEDDDWFATPREEPKRNGASLDSEPAADEDEHEDNGDAQAPMSSGEIPEASGANAVSTNPAQKQKRVKKRDTRHKNIAAVQSAKANDTGANESKQEKYRSKVEKLEKKAEQAPSTALAAGQSKAEEPEVSGPAGFRTATGTEFRSLESLHAPELYKKRGLACVGIVIGVDVREEANSRGDFQGSYWLRDSSGEINVNCFDKNKDALPRPKVGHVLMFKQLVGGTLGSESAPVGYSGTFRAGCYDPSNRTQFKPAARGLTIEKEELTGCVDLSDWYKGVSGTDAGDSSGKPKKTREITKLKDLKEDVFCDVIVLIVRKWTREHPPEISVTDFTENELFGDPSQSKYCLSDRTNTPMPNSYVYKIGLWEKTAEIAEVIEPGQYYHLKNLKPRIGKGGFLEGSMGGNRLDGPDHLRRLRDSSDLLKDLRLRKIDFLKRNGPSLSRAASDNGTSVANVGPQAPTDLGLDVDSGSSSTSLRQVTTISEMEPQKHYTFVAEVLKRYDALHLTDVFVTDYTSNPRLNAYNDPPPGWAPPPGHRTLQVSVWDDFREKLGLLSVGGYVKFENVLMRTVMQKGTAMAGKIGTSAGRHCSITIVSEDDPSLIELKRRKNEVYRRMEVGTLDSPPSAPQTPVHSQGSTSASETDREEEGSTPPTSPPDLGSNTRSISTTTEAISAPPIVSVEPVKPSSGLYRHVPTTSISEVRRIANDTGVFRVRARVAAFFPYRLREFVRETCSKCDGDDNVPVPSWQFSFVLQDDSGGQLPNVACMDDDAARLLDNMEPTNLLTNRQALQALRDRLKPLLGNLEDIQLKVLKDTENLKKAQIGKAKGRQSPREPLERIPGQWAYWMVKCWKDGRAMRWGVVDCDFEG